MYFKLAFLVSFGALGDLHISLIIYWNVRGNFKRSRWLKLKVTYRRFSRSSSATLEQRCTTPFLAPFRTKWTACDAITRSSSRVSLYAPTRNILGLKTTLFLPLVVQLYNAEHLRHTSITTKISHSSSPTFKMLSSLPADSWASCPNT